MFTAELVPVNVYSNTFSCPLLLFLHSLNNDKLCDCQTRSLAVMPIYTNLEGKDFRSRYFLPKISIWSSILNSFIWGYWGNLLSGNSNYAPCVLNYLFGSKLRSNWSPANIIIICWRSKNLDSDWSLNTHVYLCLWLRACMLGIRNSAVSLNWNIASTEGYFGATSGDVLALAFLAFSYWLLCPFWVLMLWFISWNLHYWLWSVLVYYLTFAVKTNLKLR